MEEVSWGAGDPLLAPVFPTEPPETGGGPSRQPDGFLVRKKEGQEGPGLGCQVPANTPCFLGTWAVSVGELILGATAWGAFQEASEQWDR